MLITFFQHFNFQHYSELLDLQTPAMVEAGGGANQLGGLQQRGPRQG
jgi:hypothetical protein